MSEFADRFAELSARAAGEALERCCASRRWVAGMLARRPFRDLAAAQAAAIEVWNELDEADWLEAFAAHPRIGAGRVREAWSQSEQSGVDGASSETLVALAERNVEYEDRFGFVFLICATGLGADEMLAALERRLGRARQEELRTAANEQAKITELRLRRLADEL